MFQTHRFKVVSIYTHIKPLQPGLQLLIVIHCFIMLMPMQMDGPLIKIRPFGYRVMEQYNFLVLPDQFAILFHPLKNPVILFPRMIVHEIIMIPFYQKLLPGQPGQYRKSLFRTLHRHIAQNIDLIIRRNGIVPVLLSTEYQLDQT